MAPIVSFEQVGKRYTLHRDRPRSLRDAFLRAPTLRRSPADRADLFWALRDVSFDIQPGTAVGLIGANGAGKSTVLKLISRVNQPTVGRVTVRGRVAALLELGTGFHPELSGRENIFLSGALIGMSRAEMSRKYAAIVAFSELEDFIDVQVKHYSSGMFARLAFAVSIHLDPDVLLVDEVLAVGDQAFQVKCMDRIGEMQRAGVTICLVSHSPDTVRQICQHAIWFDHGRVVAQGSAESVVRGYLDHSLQIVESRAPEPPEQQAERRWGNRRVEITQVRLLDAAAQEQSLFETGQPLSLEISYLAREPVSDAVFGMSIARQDGVHVTGPNTGFAGLSLPTLSGPGLVVYTVPNLPLLEGHYFISVSAHNQADTEMFDFHDRLYSFRVVNRAAAVRERFGLVTLQGQWRICPGAGSPATHPPPLEPASVPEHG